MPKLCSEMEKWRLERTRSWSRIHEAKREAKSMEVRLNLWVSNSLHEVLLTVDSIMESRRLRFISNRANPCHKTITSG